MSLPYIGGAAPVRRATPDLPTAAFHPDAPAEPARQRSEPVVVPPKAVVPPTKVKVRTRGEPIIERLVVLLERNGPMKAKDAYAQLEATAANFSSSIAAELRRRNPRVAKAMAIGPKSRFVVVFLTGQDIAPLLDRLHAHLEGESVATRQQTAHPVRFAIDSNGVLTVECGPNRIDIKRDDLVKLERFLTALIDTAG